MYYSITFNLKKETFGIYNDEISLSVKATKQD